MNYVIRPMTDADLAAVIRMEDSIFPDPWPRPAFKKHLTLKRSGGLVVESEGELIGYACYRLDAGEMHLTNLAVAESHRRKAVAKNLFDRILGFAREQDSAVIFLEVRVSNAGARKFYERLGFSTVELWPDYYVSPDEDALIMVRPVTGEMECKNGMV